MTYLRTIHLSDTDAAGVVYFANLLSICHEAYEATLDHHSISLKEIIEKKAIALPIVHGEIDFFRPIFCGDKLKIDLQTEFTSEHTFEITYHIYLVKSPENCLAIAKTRHVCIDPLTRKKHQLPESIQQWLLIVSR